jgi:hypothetical protein
MGAAASILSAKRQTSLPAVRRVELLVALSERETCEAQS